MSYAEELSARYGWPLRIHSRRYDAYLVGVQPLIDTKPAAIYRFPGGDSVAFDTEIKGRDADKFHRLEAILDKEPRAFRDRCDLFRAQPADWYIELALHAMKVISDRHGPEHYDHCQHDIDGWAAHYVTKAVFEEQDVFDPYADREFIAEARTLLPWYISRYVDESSRPSAEATYKVKISKFLIPVDGYEYNVQILTAVDGKNYYYAGNGKFCKSRAEADEYAGQKAAELNAEIIEEGGAEHEEVHGGGDLDHDG